MDRVRSELLGPLDIVEFRREARRVALADVAAPPAAPLPRLAAAGGALLVRVGCHLEAAGRRLEAAERRRAPNLSFASAWRAGGATEPHHQ